MTNLSGGFCAESRRPSAPPTDGGATLVLLSDGHANEGVTDHGQLEQFAAGAQRRGITSSTIGIGLGYDEDLLAAIARGGGGNASFAEQRRRRRGGAGLGGRGPAGPGVQAASLTVRRASDVTAVRLFNDLPATAIEDGFMVELGDLYAARRAACCSRSTSRRSPSSAWPRSATSSSAGSTSSR